MTAAFRCVAITLGHEARTAGVGGGGGGEGLGGTAGGGGGCGGTAGEGGGGCGGTAGEGGGGVEVQREKGGGGVEVQREKGGGCGGTAGEGGGVWRYSGRRGGGVWRYSGRRGGGGFGFGFGACLSRSAMPPAQVPCVRPSYWCNGLRYLFIFCAVVRCFFFLLPFSFRMCRCAPRHQPKPRPSTEARCTGLLLDETRICCVLKSVPDVFDRSLHPSFTPTFSFAFPFTLLVPLISPRWLLPLVGPAQTLPLAGS